MTDIRLAGFQTGSDLGTVSATVGGETGSVVIPAYQSPSAARALPRISSGFDTDTLTVDTTGLNNVTAYDWRDVSDGSTLATTATLTGTGHGGKYVECETTSNEGVRLSPPIMVYSSTMMGMAMPAGHLVDDAGMIAVCPHSQATSIAIADGPWTSAATWREGKVPRNGARVLIPNGLTVTYNESRNYRLDWVRVDGVLTWALDRSTRMLVETLIGTRGSELIMGTGAGRLPAQYTAKVIISGRDYSANSQVSTDLNLSRDPALWGRGIIAQGVWRAWGTDKLQWADADPLDVGATGLWLHKIPTGWVVGDDIVIFGTKVTNTLGQPLTVQDEIRTITEINGSVVSWSEPLIHPHKNQLTGSTRTDLYPKIMLKRGRNISIQSEAKDISRRGHTTSAHCYSTVDLWDVDFLDLGRTDKSRPVGKMNDAGEFLVHDGRSGPVADGIITETFTSLSNIAARYPVHMHHVGFGHTGARPIVHSCYVEGTPGWGMVHHSCDVDFEACGIYDFWGAGMVAESGNELGGWVGNLAGYSTVSRSDDLLYFDAKLVEGNDGLAGNNFKFGYAFAYRGRGVRATANVGVSCPWGHVFYHRNNPNDDVFPAVDLKREYIDIGDVGRINPISNADDFSFGTYPILHFSDNEAVAVLGGVHITKQNPIQSHDVNIKLKRFKAWGFEFSGANIEYIGVYILDKFDIVGGNGAEYGIQLAANTYQLATINARIEGCDVGLKRDRQSTAAVANLFDDTNDPRWMDVGNDFIDNVTVDLEFKDTGTTDGIDGSGTKLGPEVTFSRDDFDDTTINYDMDPSDTYPLVLGTWDGSVNNMTNQANNTDGRKVSNLNSTSSIAPKVWDDVVFAKNGFDTRVFSQDHEGYWQVDLGSGAENVLVVRDIISDPLTGRPHRFIKMYQIERAGGPTSSVNNGAFNYSATPTVQADKVATVAENGTVNINVVTGATGGDGTSYALVEGMFIAPDHGKATFNFATGVVTYKPDRDFDGTDEFYVFVESGGQSATVRIDVLVGAGGAVAGPAVTTHFTAADHVNTNTIGVQLLAPPATGGRRIDLVQYSTDGGTSWRRLTHGWVEAVHKITVESDGTAISAGSYDLRIRYKTNYDYTVSGASADVQVTVS